MTSYSCVVQGKSKAAATKPATSANLDSQLQGKPLYLGVSIAFTKSDREFRDTTFSKMPQSKVFVISQRQLKVLGSL